MELFGPNNHSRYAISWLPVGDELSASVRAIVKEGFGVSTPGEVLQVDEWGMMSTNFKVSSSEGTFLLRKNIKDNSDEKLLVMERLMGFCRERGILIPQVKIACTGKPFFLIDTHLWQLFDFIPGNHYRGTESELAAAAGAIAKLHRALRELPFVPAPEKPLWTESSWHELFKKATDDESDVARCILTHERMLAGAVARVLVERPQFSQLSHQVIHADLHPQNTIFAQEALRAILDFGDARQGELARDIGGACHRFVRQHVVVSEKPWGAVLEQGVQLFLDAYQKEAPLSRQDLEHMPALIVDELLRKTSSIVQQYYSGTRTDLVGGGEIEKMMVLIEEAQEVGEVITHYRATP